MAASPRYPITHVAHLHSLLHVLGQPLHEVMQRLVLIIAMPMAQYFIFMLAFVM